MLIWSEVSVHFSFRLDLPSKTRDIRREVVRPVHQVLPLQGYGLRGELMLIWHSQQGLVRRLLQEKNRGSLASIKSAWEPTKLFYWVRYHIILCGKRVTCPLTPVRRIIGRWASGIKRRAGAFKPCFGALNRWIYSPKTRFLITDISLCRHTKTSGQAWLRILHFSIGERVAVVGVGGDIGYFLFLRPSH